MAEKKDGDRVMAEITLSHVLRLATEQDSPLSREQALAFLNQERRAFELDCETHFGGKAIRLRVWESSRSVAE